MPTLPSWVRLPVESPDPAGNWAPSHTHVANGLTVDYRWVGPRAADLMPFMQYRLREEAPGNWVLEGTQNGTRWERQGPVTASDLQLSTGSTYVITHLEGEPCGMTIAIAPGSSPDVTICRHESA
jgi:hypothetical protein